MFDDFEIEYREYLDEGDFARAEEMVSSGRKLFGEALNYLRGWAYDYAMEAEIDTRAAVAHERRAY